MLCRYNCEDPGCYKDLARLRGVKYFTWENTSMLVQQDPVSNCISNKKKFYSKFIIKRFIINRNSVQGTHPDGGAHAKFTNYSFDVTEFLRIVSQAKDYIKNHDSFKKFISTQTQRKIKNIGKKNHTSATNDINRSATPKSKEVTELKSDVQSKDEL